MYPFLVFFLYLKLILNHFVLPLVFSAIIFTLLFLFKTTFFLFTFNDLPEVLLQIVRVLFNFAGTLIFLYVVCVR